MTSTDDPALIDFDSTLDAHARLIRALEDLAATSPEAAALRSLVTRASIRYDLRDEPATNHAEREIQFLADMRGAAESGLENVIPHAQKKRGVTWHRIGQLLGVSRQAAHERYAI